jgi:hypothetical protein
MEGQTHSNHSRTDTTSKNTTDVLRLPPRRPLLAAASMVIGIRIAIAQETTIVITTTILATITTGRTNTTNVDEVMVVVKAAAAAAAAEVAITETNITTAAAIEASIEAFPVPTTATETRIATGVADSFSCPSDILYVL